MLGQQRRHFYTVCYKFIQVTAKIDILDLSLIKLLQNQ